MHCVYGRSRYPTFCCDAAPGFLSMLHCSQLVTPGATKIFACYFAGGFFGNSQLLEVALEVQGTTRDSGDEISCNVQVLDACVVENMAPVHASLVVPHRARTQHLAATRNIVQIGGAGCRSTLRATMFGMGLTELAGTEGAGIDFGFPRLLSARSEAIGGDLIAFSYHAEGRTQFMRLSTQGQSELESLQEREAPYLARNATTVALSLSERGILQVTEDAVVLLNEDGTQKLSSLEMGGKITKAASVARDMFVAAVLRENRAAIIKADPLRSTISVVSDELLHSPGAESALQACTVTALSLAWPFAIAVEWNCEAIFCTDMRKEEPSWIRIELQGYQPGAARTARSSAISAAADGSLNVYVGLGDGVVASYRLELSSGKGIPVSHFCVGSTEVNLVPQEDSFFVYCDAGAHITHHAEGDRCIPVQLGSCGRLRGACPVGDSIALVTETGELSITLLDKECRFRSISSPLGTAPVTRVWGAALHEGSRALFLYGVDSPAPLALFDAHTLEPLGSFAQFDSNYCIEL